ncbi:peptide MFS transporter [Stieleria varia]|uniref:Putative dipeptide and tripeptide permease YjdL n=1 Tax=Stieleria varia TaxID=2528005 RepID=A0A5C6B595_9BACT|nr:peptide MFS transporter [Stieleria varia]TWU06479.1 putative dipeptide and tripeptide permease YjdL [Stieleria varia]
MAHSEPTDTNVTSDAPAANVIDFDSQHELLGHPTGLYTLFFAEMWERFSYYGMRALLLFYMMKGFLGFGDKDANAVYGAYTALVYMTPFFGGMIADKLLGARTTVVIGGVLMALGHLLMTLQTDIFFFTALALLIAGNGFFKPNISTIVGSLYPPGSTKRDGGFTIFYIGINLGAAMAPLLCGYIGETYGWHYGFGLATIGMMVGLAVFVAPTIVTQVMILGTALLSAYGLVFYNPGDVFTFITNVAVAVALLISGTIAVMALAKGGLPAEAGRTTRPESYFPNLTKVLIGTAVVIPILVLLVSGFSVVPGVNEMARLIPEHWTKPLEDSKIKLVRGFAEFVKEASRPAGLILIIAGIGASFYLIREALRMERVPRQRMFVVFVLTFFSLLFWAFFEQSGSSVNNFTDRNIDRVVEESLVTDADVGKTVDLRVVPASDDPKLAELEYLSQEYLGHENGNDELGQRVRTAITAVEEEKEPEKRMKGEELEAMIKEVTEQPLFTMSALTYLREYAKSDAATPADHSIKWQYTAENVGKIGLGGTEIPASVYQSVNPIYIMIFGLAFSMLWSFLGARGREPSTPVKFAFGLIQLGMGFGCLYFGAKTCDSDGMVSMVWLLLMYLLLTTGELCLSPVGLSMITKLSPARLVSTVMGAWFLATAFSQFLAAIIAQFAAVNDGGNFVPVPSKTVNIYGDVYFLVALMAIGSGVVCLFLSPLLKKWMHVDAPQSE